MKCHFCEEPAAHRCAWPVPGTVLIPALELRAGDIVHSQKHRGRIGQVIEVEECTFHVKFRSNIKNLKNPRGYSRFNTAPVQVERMVPCGVPVCDRHERELSETRHYCASHWHAWEQVA